MKKKKTSMSRTLIIGMLAIHLSVLFLALLVNFLHMYGISRQQTFLNSHAKLDYLEYQVENLYSSISDIQRLFMQDKQLKEYMSTERVDTVEDIELRIYMNERLVQLVNFYAHIKSITVFQADGAILNVSGTRSALEKSPVQPLPVQNTEAFQDSKNLAQVSWGGCFPHYTLIPAPSALPDKGEVVAMLLPVADYWNPEKISVLSINVSKSYFDFLLSPELENGAKSYLLDKGGDRIYGTEPESNASRQPYGETLLAQNLKEGNFTVSAGRALWEIVYKQNEKTGWYLVQEVPYTAILSDMMRLQFSTGVTFLVSTLIVVTLSYLVVWSMIQSLRRIIRDMSDIGNGELGKRLPDMRYAELSQLSFQFNEMMERIQVLHQKNVRHEQELRVSEIETLQAQINPHFLHNSLITIRWMASMARASNASQAIQALNQVLYPVFSQKSITWSLAMEQNFVKSYVEIMGFRFGETISCDYHIPEELGQLEILRFILQPAVENAITHGLLEAVSGKIDIIAQREGGDLLIDVTDNGKGIQEKALAEIRQSLLKSTRADISGHGFGLYNVNRRIRLHYGEAYGISIRSELGRGTAVSIKIPVGQMKNQIQADLEPQENQEET